MMTTAKQVGDLVLIGAGGFGRETAQAVHALNGAGAVLGGKDLIGELPDASFVVCTGRPGDYVSRLRIVADLDLAPERFATIVHPSAAVSLSSSI